MLICLVSYKFSLNQNCESMFLTFFFLLLSLCNQYFCEANILTVALINNHDKSVNKYIKIKL